MYGVHVVSFRLRYLYCAAPNEEKEALLILEKALPVIMHSTLNTS